MARPFHPGLFEADGFIYEIIARFSFSRHTQLPPFTSRLVKTAVASLDCLEPIRRAYAEKRAYKRVTLSVLHGPRGPVYKRRKDAPNLSARPGQTLWARIAVYTRGWDPGLAGVMGCTGRLQGPLEGVTVSVEEARVTRLEALAPPPAQRLTLEIHTPLLLTQKLLTPPFPRIQRYMERVPQAHRLLPTPGYLAAAAAHLWLGVVHDRDPGQSPIPYSLARLADLLVAEEDYRIQPTTAVYSGGEKPRLARGVTGRITMRILEKRMAETLPRLLALAQALGLGRSRSIGFGEVTLRVHEPSP